MRETKLILLFKHFKSEELKAFDKFIHSPYFNTNETLTKLWLLLKKYAPDFDASQLANEKVFKKLFPKTVYNEKRLRQLRSQLFKIVEEFLAIERFKEDRFRFKKAIGDAFLEKGMKDNFERKYDELQKSFETEAFLSTSGLHQKMSLHHQLYFNELNVKGDKCSTDLVKGTLLLEKYYVQELQIYTLEWLSSNLPYNHEIPQNILTYIEVLKQQPNIDYLESTQSIFENAIRLLIVKDNEEGLFDGLNKQLSKCYTSLNAKAKNLLLRLLINYCIHLEDKGNKSTNAIFELYKLGLTDRAIFYKGLMTNSTFINIVSNALNLGKKAWAKSFINQEKHRLYEAQKEQYLLLVETIVLYHEQAYEDCLTMLTKMEKFDLLTLELPKRNLQIRTIFECYQQGQIDVKMLYAYLEKHQKYLQRKQTLSDNKRNAYQHFGKYLLRLVHWCEKKRDKEQLRKLKQDLMTVTPFPDKSRDWLMKHIDKLENKNGVTLRTPSYSN